LENAFDNQDKLHLAEHDDFMMAFGLHGFYSGLKADPRYIKWVARHFISEEGRITERLIPMHPCTEEDFAKFYPPDKRSASLV